MAVTIEELEEASNRYAKGVGDGTEPFDGWAAIREAACADVAAEESVSDTVPLWNPRKGPNGVVWAKGLAMVTDRAVVVIVDGQEPLRLPLTRIGQTIHLSAKYEPVGALPAIAVAHGMTKAEADTEALVLYPAAGWDSDRAGAVRDEFSAHIMTAAAAAQGRGEREPKPKKRGLFSRR